jgi:hypothetical protein
VSPLPMNETRQLPWISLYALCTCIQGARPTSLELATIERLAGEVAELRPLTDLAAALEEVAATRQAHRRDPLAPVVGLRGGAARPVLAAACDLALATGEMTLEQNMALDALRARMGLGDAVLEAMIEEKTLALLPSVELAAPKDPMELDELNRPVVLTPDLAAWKDLSRAAKSKLSRLARYYRHRGLFAEQRDLSDIELASALYRYRKSTYTAEVADSEWEYLGADRSRVWTLDFTGNDSGAHIDLAAATRHLARISAGTFAPSRIEARRARGGARLDIELDGQTLELKGLIDSPIHFDLVLLERLSDAVPELAFIGGVSEDLHYFMVVAREHLAGLSRRRGLSVLSRADFREFRHWAREYGSGPED